MRTIRVFLAMLVALGLVVAPVAAQQKTAAQPAAGKSVSIAFKQFTLKNGLRVILSEDHNAPTFSISVNYNVGSANERQGRTGFAHLFEHMMFQGSKNVGKGEHFILVFNNGGGMNGTTNNDRTVYFETLPANQLDLALFLEADRMRSLDISQANLDNQRNAVQEERRQGLDNQPYGKTFEALDETAYDNFAYKHSVIGSMADLNAATVDDVKQFFTTYYAPNNAVLALVGDFKTKDALAKIKKHFEDIPTQPKAAAVDLTEPAQNGERRKALDDPFARVPMMNIIFKTVPNNTPDWYALDVAGSILSRGQSSRLYQKLVRDKRVALQVFGGPGQRRGTVLFQVGMLLTPGGDFAAVEKLVWEELERLQKEPVTAEEIQKVMMMNRRQRAQQLQGTLFRAVGLTELAVAFNDPNMINTILDKYAKVTPADIQRVAQAFFKESNRTVITTTPKPRSGSGN